MLNLSFSVEEANREALWISKVYEQEVEGTGLPSNVVPNESTKCSHSTSGGQVSSNLPVRIHSIALFFYYFFNFFQTLFLFFLTSRTNMAMCARSNYDIDFPIIIQTGTSEYSLALFLFFPTWPFCLISTPLVPLHFGYRGWRMSGNFRNYLDEDEMRYHCLNCWSKRYSALDLSLRYGGWMARRTKASRERWRRTKTLNAVMLAFDFSTNSVPSN